MALYEEYKREKCIMSISLETATLWRQFKRTEQRKLKSKDEKPQHSAEDDIKKVNARGLEAQQLSR